MRGSGVFEHDAFNQIGYVFAAVGYGFEQLVHGFEFDEFTHVLLFAKQAAE